MLTVTSRAATYDLTVLAAVKAELGITDRADDEKLTGYIRQASNAVAKFCNRVFARETVSESLRFRRRTEDLIQSRYPVTAVASVVENDTTLAEADYERDDDSGVLLRLRSGGQSCWPPGLVTVVCTAGYALLSDLTLWDRARGHPASEAIRERRGPRSADPQRSGGRCRLHRILQHPRHRPSP